MDWTKYTPPISEANPGDGTHASIIDPTQTVPLCQDAFTGSRNQNIYFSRITEGLLVGSPQDAKPLSATFQRAFVVTMQNQTNQDRTFTLTLTAEAGVWASFLQAPSPAVPGQPLSPSLPVTQTLTVTIPARSGAARPVFAFSSTKPAGRMKVSVVESVSNGLSGSIVLNPEGSVSPLTQPDDTDPNNANIGSLEIYTPTFQVWSDDQDTNPNPYVNISSPGAAIQNISNQNISNQNISNADPAIQNISNQNISNQNISNQNISNQNISNPSPAIQNISNQNISNQNISNTTAANQNISNQNISNQNISNQNISNTPITDATYAMTNVGQYDALLPGRAVRDQFDRQAAAGHRDEELFDAGRRRLHAAEPAAELRPRADRHGPHRLLADRHRQRDGPEHPGCEHFQHDRLDRARRDRVRDAARVAQPNWRWRR